ncbi:Type I pilus usher pathway chaperone CsuC [Novosphingobium sp. KN65.2]|nr:Type I pilus usher pathway chaperone CsuC [Novosphingobium sp. KN65.2]
MAMGEAKSPKGFAAFLVASALAVLPLRAPAATVMIWPIDPVIGEGRGGTELWLENRGAADVVLQIRVMRWTQEAGSDVHSDQDEVLASPPMVKVGPGVRQLVRLVAGEPLPRDRERAYRVIVDEIPAVADRPEEMQTATALRFRMRYSIPLFLAPEKGKDKREPAMPQVSCRLIDQGRTVQLANSGSMHARLADAVLDAGQETVPIAPGLLGYVLAGSTMEWAVPGKPATTGALRAKVNGDAKQVALGACKPI